MFDKAITVIAACLYYSGLVRLGRWWMRRQGPQLIVLNYHTATPGSLRFRRLCLIGSGLSKMVIV